MNFPKKIKINKKNIKYLVKNTPLEVTITKDSNVYFHIDPKDEKLLINNDLQAINEYKKKLDKTIEYLELEGFL